MYKRQIADGACDCAGNVDLGCGCGEAAAAENFDCDGNCIADVDCAGVCGGTAVVDICGVCDGITPSYYWCDGSSDYGNGPWGADCPGGIDEGAHCCDQGYDAYGDCAALEDCNGDFMGTAELDCDGNCGGTAELDACGECGGENTCLEFGCPDGTVMDCANDGECAPESYLADGWCDGEDQPFGYDLTCLLYTSPSPRD